MSGHRLSTAEIESALVSHPAVAEAAVIANTDEPDRPAVLAYVTSVGESPRPGLGGPARARRQPDRQARQAEPDHLGDDLPKTRSGKIMRRLLRDVAEGREPGDVTTLRDASVLAQLQQATAGQRISHRARGWESGR